MLMLNDLKVTAMFVIFIWASKSRNQKKLKDYLASDTLKVASENDADKSGDTRVTHSSDEYLFVYTSASFYIKCKQQEYINWWSGALLHDWWSGLVVWSLASSIGDLEPCFMIVNPFPLWRNSRSLNFKSPI